MQAELVDLAVFLALLGCYVEGNIEIAERSVTVEQLIRLR
jgi:hypothetical protein